MISPYCNCTDQFQLVLKLTLCVCRHLGAGYLQEHDAISQDGDAPLVEVQLLILYSRPCCQLQLIAPAVESTEGYFLLMRNRWCVLEGKERVDVRETVEVLLCATKVGNMFYEVL